MMAISTAFTRFQVLTAVSIKIKVAVLRMSCRAVSAVPWFFQGSRYLHRQNSEKIIFWPNLFVKQDRFEFEDEAVEAVRKGRAWGALHFSSDYSLNLKERMENARSASDLVVNQSSVMVQMDMSSEYYFYLPGFIVN